jgi:hypothetical protein
VSGCLALVPISSTYTASLPRHLEYEGIDEAFEGFDAVADSRLPPRQPGPGWWYGRFMQSRGRLGAMGWNRKRSISGPDPSLPTSITLATIKSS